MLQKTFLFFFLIIGFFNMHSQNNHHLATWPTIKTVVTTSATTTGATTVATQDTLECAYSGWALNSVFNLPILRYNIYSFDTKNSTLGSLEYFNSLGAGISISWGKIHVSSKTNLRQAADDSKTITMKNVIGFNAGVLFSKSDSIGKAGARIIFAPTVSVQVLDLQIGFGYELGTVSNSAHRCILTFSYGIPLTKFTNTGSYLLHNPRINSPGTTTNMNMKGFF